MTVHAEAFTERQLDEMSRAAQAAGERTGLTFSVFVGQSEAGAPDVFVERLLAASDGDPGRSVVILVDPVARRVEIATGKQAAAHLSDSSCGLAALSMSSSFAGGDIPGGVVTGLRMLGDAAFWSAGRAAAG